MEFKVNYRDYFKAFDDIDQLKQATIVWIDEDIQRLKSLESQVDLWKETAENNKKAGEAWRLKYEELKND